jgi:hypothetical protein
MTVKYLICADREQGMKDAVKRGWTCNAYARVVSPNKDDIRLVWRFSEFHTQPGGKAQMFKSSDYEDGPANPDLLERWIREKEAFDKFVSEGHGMWVEA